jgi:asparagine synthase (glutamine-hydrolysing)
MRLTPSHFSNRLLYADTKTYLHELLMKQDQMSMATSIESRVPFLDHKLVEFTAKLPERLKLRAVQQSMFCEKV